MSTVTVNNIVIATINRKGLSSPEFIEIDVSDLTFNAQANAVMVTFDAAVQPYVVGGSFKRHSIEIEPTTQSGKPQTSILLIAEGPIQPKIVLGTQPSPLSPVNWRALGIAFAGPFVRNTDSEVVSLPTQTEEGFITLPEPWEGTQRAYVGFFASIDPPPTILEGDEGHVLPKGTTFDGSDRIDAYVWNEESYLVGGKDEGPWFYAALQVRWNTITYRPPPTESDGFWALPGPCQASDVFLINNNSIAPYWDVPEVNVWAEPDTLLLNFTDEEGTRWSMLDMEGWWTLPPPALPDLPRPGYLNGSFPVDGRYEPRIITLRGMFIPGHNVSVAKPRLRLLRSLDSVRTGALLVAKEPMGYNVEMFDFKEGIKEWDEGPWPKQAWVWLSDQPKVETLDASGRTEFEVQLKAVDPVKYLSGARGMERKYIDWAGSDDGRDYTTDESWSPERGQRYTPAPGRAYGSVDYDVNLPATNKGTANIWPRFFIYGPVADAKILNKTTNQVMVFQGTIRAGEVLIVDCYWRTVVMRPSGDVTVDDFVQSDANGLNKRWMLRLSSPWIYLQPGENELQFYGNGVNMAGDPPGVDDVNKTQCWVVYRSGWMGS